MAGEGYIGAGGQRFMSSVAARASMPGGYTRTTYYPGGNPYYTGPKTGLSSAARSAFSKALKQYEPSGAYGKGIEAALERGRKKSVAKGQQALVSAGLAGTSMLAAPGQRYEEEVATPARMQVEETRAARLSELYAMLAGAEQQGYETMLGRETRFPTFQSPMPTITPTTSSDYGYKDIPIPNFTLPNPNRLASAMQQINKPPVGSPAALWAMSPKTWGQSLEAEWARAGSV